MQPSDKLCIFALMAIPSTLSSISPVINPRVSSLSFRIIPSTLSSISPVINPRVSSLSFRINQTRPFLPPSGANPSSPHRRRLLLPSQALSPQPPPQTDPPPENGSNRLKGVVVSMSRLQDRVQIFLAVLFWMSLFFWASVWDKRNTGHGRSNKGSRFRR